MIEIIMAPFKWYIIHIYQWSKLKKLKHVVFICMMTKICHVFNIIFT